MIHVETSSGLFPVVDETGELRLHARTLTHAGSKGWRRTETAARNDYIAMQARSDRAYRPVCTAIHLHSSNQAPGVTN